MRELQSLSTIGHCALRNLLAANLRRFQNRSEIALKIVEFQTFQQSVACSGHTSPLLQCNPADHILVNLVSSIQYPNEIGHLMAIITNHNSVQRSWEETSETWRDMSETETSSQLHLPAYSLKTGVLQGHSKTSPIICSQVTFCLSPKSMICGSSGRTGASSEGGASATSSAQSSDILYFWNTRYLGFRGRTEMTLSLQS